MNPFNLKVSLRPRGLDPNYPQKLTQGTQGSSGECYGFRKFVKCYSFSKFVRCYSFSKFVHPN